MKTRHVILILALALFSSCVVKSLKPFYLTQHLKFNKELVGHWKSGKSSTWHFISFKEEWEKENEGNTSLMKESKEAFEKYKEGYVAKYVSLDKEALFLAMPFMVKDHLFLDFTPFEYESEDLNSLAAQHLLKTHSVAYVDFQDDGTIKLKWLDESVVKPLIRENKMRIKYEETGFDEDFVLTASSEELYAFLEKFMASDLDKKWDKDSIKTLRPDNAKP